MTIKKYIQRYLKLKLQNGELKIGQIIFSENQIAIKFNCSRLTARSAIQPFVSMGLLESKKGAGYVISKNNYFINYFLLDESEKFQKISLNIIDCIDSKIIKLLELKKDLAKYFFIEKEYYVDKSNLKFYQLIVVKKSKLINIASFDLSKGLGKALSLQGIIIGGVQTQIGYINSVFINKKIKNFGFSDDALYQLNTVFGEDGQWFEKTMLFSYKKNFIIKFNKVSFE